jgi:5S rRNA maturation endonuclease (ribonuclease M5)/KaiC/GvpD/RAD55 family RecA-like ATPase
MKDEDLLRTDRAALEQILIDAGAEVKGNSVKCPFHEDHHPSGSIYEHDGIWRFKCMACDAGGDIYDVKALVNGTTASDELKKASGTKKHNWNKSSNRQNTPAFANLDAVRDFLKAKYGPIEYEHAYDNQIVFRCRTRDGKTYRPFHLEDDGYRIGAADKPLPLYNKSALAEADTIIIVEGEKCVDILKHYGFTATTSAGGAKNAKSTDWTPLADKKVIIWPDFDAEGRRYAADVEGILQTLSPAPKISIVDPANLDLAEHEDIADFVQQLQALEKSDAEITASLDEIFRKAKVLSIASEVRQRFSDIQTGRYEAISWPWVLLSELTKALQPGKVTTLAGSPGASKSLFVLQPFAYWVSLGLRVALFEAEEDRTFHLTRALAQESKNAWLTDPDEIKNRGEEADRIAEQYEDFLDKFGRIIHASPDIQPSLEQLAAWIEEQAKRGCRIIGIDPVTSATQTGDVWKADKEFLHTVKRTAENYGCSVLLVTHPVKQVTFPDMTQIAGAACYQRFSQTILWLEHHEEKTSRIRMACGSSDIEHNKTLYILKANIGKGGGYKLAYNFNAESLTLHEEGLILRKKKN